MTGDVDINFSFLQLPLRAGDEAPLEAVAGFCKNFRIGARPKI